ncbi:MAG: ABC transporter substrate-binding protein [Christensenellaceae bacterium]|nr:ABC transporter substrate-binding protein [Christensenellaceae bacterium]
MKRFLSVLLAVTLLLGLGGAAMAEKVQVEFWYGLGGPTGELMQQLIAEFNASQDKYEVVGTTQGSYTETFQNIQAPIAGGNPPALAVLEYGQVNNLALKGVLEDVQPYIDASADYKSDDVIEAFREQGRYGEALYALPLQGTTQVLYYDKAAFAQAGIDAEEALNTWEGLVDAERKITKKDESGKTTYYGWEPMWGYWNLMDIAYANGGKLLSEDGTQVLVNTPEWVEAWELIRKAIHEEGIMRVHSTGQGWEYWYATIDDVMQGRAAGYTGSAGDQGDLDFGRIAAHIQPGMGGNKGAAVVEATQLVVLAGAPAEAKQGAFDFVTFMTNTQNTARWSMKTGYIAVRKSAQDDPTFKAYAEQNPQVLVPLKQASEIGIPTILDPTGNAIFDALRIATDLVEVEGISAQEALDEAQEIGQAALDKALKSR